MPKSLRSKIKHLCYKGELNERERDRILDALDVEPCEDCISREALRQKLQEHHNFFVNAYGSFKDMTFKEKARVDEIDNCIAMVINGPSVTPQPKIGHWITTRTFMHDGEYYCDKCKCDAPNNEKWDYCPNCGAKMEVEE